MISVHEADALLNDNLVDFGLEATPLLKAHNRVLKEKVLADREQPPFHRVAMDGIAISFEFFKKGIRQFSSEAVHQAGCPAPTLNSPSNCFEVMTGAPLPIGTDTVIRVEDTVRKGEKIEITTDEIVPWQNIHQHGSDLKKGDIILEPNTMILGPQMATLASVGKTCITVSKVPRIAVISTGNELVNIDESPLPHQIRKSNVHGINASLMKNHFSNVQLFHFLDDKNEINQELATCVSNFDVFILSGGVSMGQFDFIPEQLSRLGVKKIFHKIKQRPGKPFWFGVLDNKKPFYALPGNPVSTLICFHRYVLPHLYRCMGIQLVTSKVKLSEKIVFEKDLTYFSAVKLLGNSMAKPIKTNGSGDFSSLAHSDGFIEMPSDKNILEINEEATFYNW